MTPPREGRSAANATKIAQEMSYGTGRKWHTVTNGNGELARASQGASEWWNASDTQVSECRNLDER